MSSRPRWHRYSQYRAGRLGRENCFALGRNQQTRIQAIQGPADHLVHTSDFDV